MGGINVAKQHRDSLSTKIDSIALFLNGQEHSAEQQQALADVYALKSEFKGKKFGLRFEEHREQVDGILDDHVPTLEDDESLTIRQGGEQNFLIEGDNLIALDLLTRTHAGRIDLIYIDPPYNLGGDFRYGDDYVDKNDLFKHSKWLSFMDRRLRKAKRLLSSKGSIFISINDTEQAPLKMLCDDVFGPDCFQGCICWQKTYSPRNDKHGIPAECEYIYVYSKLPDWMPKKLGRTAKMDSIYKNPDGDSSPWTSDNPCAPNAATHQGMVYAIQHPFTGQLLYPYNASCWRYDQETMLDIMNGWCRYELRDLHDEARRAEVCGVAESEVRKCVPAIMLADSLEESSNHARIIYERGPWPRFFFTKNGLGGIRRKTYLDKVEGRMPTNYWPYLEVGHTDEAKKELKRVFGGKIPFDTPKPIRLIERILDIASDDDSIVLDFFAGSASTAHAILQHNYEYGGHRRFIMCTNNENGICREVAYERIRRAIEGYSFTGTIKKTVFDEKVQSRHVNKPESFAKLAEQAEAARAEAETRHEKASIKVEDGHVRVVVEDSKAEQTRPLPGSLKYFRVGFVAFDELNTYAAADEVMLHVRELVELENGIDFANDPTAAIALTDDDLDTVVANLDDRCRAVYIGQDVLVPASALDLFQERLVQVNRIPAYYYRELED